MKWKRGEFKVALNPNYVEYSSGQIKTTEKDNGVRQGYISGPFAIAKSGLTWPVTHLASGKKCADKATKLASAKALCEQLLPLADWEQCNPLKTMSEDMRDVIREIVLSS